MTSLGILQRATAAIVALVMLLILWMTCTGRITSGMAHLHYALWTRGALSFQPDDLQEFTRDEEFRRQFVGQPIDTLRPLFPRLHSGARYAKYSYRASALQWHLEDYDGHRVEDFWFDGTERNFGYCVLVVDGKIRDFFFIKG